MHVLVTAASKHGATREIAEVMATTLSDAGLQADVMEPQDVVDCRPYDAVILGSAIYAGRWMLSARRFSERHRTALLGRRVWLFSSGPVGTPLTPTEPPSDGVRLSSELRARDHLVFSGRIDEGGLDFAERVITRMARSADGDFRDWKAIRGWVRSIAAELDAVRA